MSKSTMLVFLVFFLFSIPNDALSQNKKIVVTPIRNSDNSVDFKYIKNEVGNYFVQLELENVQNSVETTNVYTINLSANSGTLFKLTPIDKSKMILFSYNLSFRAGVLKPKVDSLITYALPFRENKKVTIYEIKRLDVRQDFWKSYFVYSKTKDTIYAMRKGVVVDIRKLTTTTSDNANEQPTIVYRTEVIVQHADGTNASYSGLDENSLFVKLGQTIYPQTRVGIMDDMTNAKKSHDFRFNVYYFSNDETDTTNGKKSRIVERSITPSFLTENGKQKLDNKKDYIVKYDDAIVFQEMNKEEKKKYKK